MSVDNDGTFTVCFVGRGGRQEQCRSVWHAEDEV